MALTVIKINKQVEEEIAARNQQFSDIYTTKFGY
jgi:hypothetical protein